MTFLTTTLILSILGYGNTGTAVLPLLKIGEGPRAAAMGESFTGLSDDASAIYWNPAGLGEFRRYEFALSHHQWFAGIKDEIGHVALPAGKGTLGIGLVYSGEPDVRYWNNENEQFEYFLAWSTMLSVGYGWRVADNWRLGASVTGLYNDIKLERGYGGALNLGVIGHPVKGLGVGAALRHLGVMGGYGASGMSKLPMEGALGGVYAFGKFKTTLDAVFPMLDNNPNIRAGVEYSPVKAIALRAGYRWGLASLPDLGYVNGLTGGIGVTLGNFTVDYAFVPYGELGMTHRIGLKMTAEYKEPPPKPKFGSETVVVLDAASKEPLAATLSFTGVAETTAIAEAYLAEVKPGMLEVQAAMPNYEPNSASYRIVAGKERTDTIYLTRIITTLTTTFYDAQSKEPITGTLTYQGPSSGKLTVVATPGASTIPDIMPGQYILNAVGPSAAYLPQMCTLNINPGDRAVRDFNLWRKAEPIVLEGINFETGKADILPSFYPILDRAGQILKQTTSVKKVELAGHTDPRKIHTAEFPSNWELSQARAEAVRKYLIDKWGIAPERLTAKGYADTQPIVPNTSPENMYKNRRTELRIIEQQQ